MFPLEIFEKLITEIVSLQTDCAHTMKHDTLYTFFCWFCTRFFALRFIFLHFNLRSLNQQSINIFHFDKNFQQIFTLRALLLYLSCLFVSLDVIITTYTRLNVRTYLQ